MIFWVEDDKGRVLLRRRPEKGLLGGMMEIPSSNWRENKWCVEEAIKEAPLIADWQTLPGTVRHVFTHFHLHLIVLCTRTHRMRTNAGVWCIPDQFSEHALPSVMKKVIRHVSAAVQSS
jgi:A/G-specific adenine glycosylase